MEGTARQIAVLGLAIIAFTLAVEAGGNGFIATFFAGLGFGMTARETCPHVEEFTEEPMVVVVSWTVLLSVVVHGMTATAGAAAYGRWWRAMADSSMVEAEPMPEQRMRRGPSMP